MTESTSLRRRAPDNGRASASTRTHPAPRPPEHKAAPGNMLAVAIALTASATLQEAA